VFTNAVGGSVTEIPELFEPQPEEEPKKPYTPPHLVRHGTVEDLTGGARGVNQIDGASTIA
jgi:hypothetical protein